MCLWFIRSVQFFATASSLHESNPAKSRLEGMCFVARRHSCAGKPSPPGPCRPPAPAPGHLDDHNCQTKVQILAELPAGSQLLQVPVRGREDARVALDLL